MADAVSVATLFLRIDHGPWAERSVEELVEEARRNPRVATPEEIAADRRRAEREERYEAAAAPLRARLSRHGRMREWGLYTRLSIERLTRHAARLNSRLDRRWRRRRRGELGDVKASRDRGSLLPSSKPRAWGRP